MFNGSDNDKQISREKLDQFAAVLKDKAGVQSDVKVRLLTQTLTLSPTPTLNPTQNPGLIFYCHQHRDLETACTWASTWRLLLGTVAAFGTAASAMAEYALYCFNRSQLRDQHCAATPWSDDHTCP